jgi:hypothetical protein
MNIPKDYEECYKWAVKDRRTGAFIGFVTTPEYKVRDAEAKAKRYHGVPFGKVIKWNREAE